MPGSFRHERVGLVDEPIERGRYGLSEPEARPRDTADVVFVWLLDRLVATRRRHRDPGAGKLGDTLARQHDAITRQRVLATAGERILMLRLDGIVGRSAQRASGFEHRLLKPGQWTDQWVRVFLRMLEPLDPIHRWVASRQAV